MASTIRKYFSRRAVTAVALSILTLAMTFGSIASTAGAEAHALKYRNALVTGEVLRPNQSIYSNDGCYRMTYQSDGNLVIYNRANRVKGATGTHAYRNYGTWVPGFPAFWDEPQGAEVQVDGNFVIYAVRHFSAPGTPGPVQRVVKWASGTTKKWGQPLNKFTLWDNYKQSGFDNGDGLAGQLIGGNDQAGILWSSKALMGDNYTGPGCP
jgi:hypothetical protein